MDLAVVITALTGSGGIVALLAVLLQHRQKMAELNNTNKKIHMQLEQIKNKQIPLEHHPLFTTLAEIEHFFLWSFETADPGRTTIIRELCVNKLRVWRKVLMKHVLESEKCYSECGSANREACNKAENSFRMMLLEGLEEYTGLWNVQHKTDVYGNKVYDAESFAAMKKFLPIFQEWHLSREEMVRLASRDIPNCNMNAYCYDDWWDMLTVYMYAFTQMKYDAVNAMRSLNGQITGEKIFDITIGPCSLRREADVRPTRLHTEKPT